MKKIKTKEVDLLVFVIVGLTAATSLVPFNEWYTVKIIPYLSGIYAGIAALQIATSITRFREWLKTKVVSTTVGGSTTGTIAILEFKGSLRTVLSHVEFLYAYPEKQVEELGFTLDEVKCHITTSPVGNYLVTFIKDSPTTIISINHD